MMTFTPTTSTEPQ